MRAVERRRGMNSGGVIPLPYDYEVEYLQGDGNSWIDLGFAPTFLYDNNWQLDFLYSQKKTYVFGGTSAGQAQFVITSTTFRNDWVIGADGTGTGAIYLNYRHSLIQNNNILYINKASWNITSTGKPASPNMYLFTKNPRESNTTFNGRIYSLQVTSSGGDVLFDMIPVLKDSIPCFYDKVGGTFFYNQGTGNFIAGPNKEDRVDIEYIENTGTSWIETGYIPTSDTMLQFKFMNTKATGDIIIGYCGASDNDDFRFLNYSNGIYFDSFGGARISASNKIYPNNIYEIELGNYYAKDLTNDTVIISRATQYTGTGSNSILLNGGKNMTASKNRWYYVKIYEGNTLMMDLKPVRIGSVGYMYDSVNDKLIEPVGSVVLGPDL